MKLGFLEKAERTALSNTAGEYDVDGGVPLARYQLLISADSAFHLERNAIATTDSLRIPSGQLVAVNVWGNDTLSFVLATGEADGNIWISRTDAA
ncbi:MAG: hypothetical protein JO208_08620 [Alphaproteobacteria bacterium]|nr:hypothetical protein [Alphaproteobacteria bacterium]